MFQTVVDIVTRFFSSFLPTEWRNQNKRIREDDLLETDDEDPPIKKFRMNSKSEPTGSSYFPNAFFSKTREKCSQTVEVIDLDSHSVCETISLDDTSTTPDKGKSLILKTSQLDNISPSNKKYRAPAHCRSPIKTKFKHVSSKRGGSNDVCCIGSFSAKTSSTPELFSSSSSKRPPIRRIGSSGKPYSSRTEQMISMAMRSQESIQSSAIYDLKNRMKYGELLGKVLKTPELFSCSLSPMHSVTTCSKVIDLTIDTPSTSKYSSRSDSNLTKRPTTFIDLTEQSSHKVPPSSSSSEIINVDADDTPVGTFIPHRRIVPPVNTLSSRLKHVPYTSVDYISNLVTDVENCKKDFANERKHLVKEISNLSPLRKQFEKALEERLRRHLKITSIDLDEEEEVEVKPIKPELTEEMINNVIFAWDPKKPKGQVLINKFNYQIKRADLQTLSGLNWLNDEVINFYMELLMVRGKEKSFPSVHCFSTFFYSKLIKDGYTSLKRWTRKIDLFSYDIVVVPIHLKVHWCLAIIDFEKKKITYFDSMGQSNNTCVKALLEYLSSEHMDKKKESFDTTGWELICTRDEVPQQMNSCDCGVFACTFAEYSTRKASYDFSQEDMPYFRRKMTYEILSSSLLPWS